ncbi:MAG TPA: transporter substrate-binding domain-containing protein, partial [Mesorhizobium sp.]
MKYSLRATGAALAVTVFMVGSALAQDKLKLGTEGAYPPFNTITADGKLEGFDIDVGNALCAEMKVECEWVTQDWDGIIPALQGKKFDALIASMSITEERKKQVAFTNKYYT